MPKVDCIPFSQISKQCPAPLYNVDFLDQTNKHFNTFGRDSTSNCSYVEINTMNRLVIHSYVAFLTADFKDFIVLFIPKRSMS